jgi:hypothetical protein
MDRSERHACAPSEMPGMRSGVYRTIDRPGNQHVNCDHSANIAYRDVPRIVDLFVRAKGSTLVLERSSVKLILLTSFSIPGNSRHRPVGIYSFARLRARRVPSIEEFAPAMSGLTNGARRL